MKRLFWVALGASVGVMAVREASKLAEKLAPTSVLGGLARNVNDFLDEVRIGMAEREDQLRHDLGLTGVEV